jgi:hypothetical protein
MTPDLTTKFPRSGGKTENAAGLFFTFTDCIKATQAWAPGMKSKKPA